MLFCKVTAISCNALVGLIVKQGPIFIALQVEVMLERTGEMTFRRKHQPDPSLSKMPSEEFLVENALGPDIERRSENTGIEKVMTSN